MELDREKIVLAIAPFVRSGYPAPQFRPEDPVAIRVSVRDLGRIAALWADLTTLPAASAATVAPAIPLALPRQGPTVERAILKAFGLSEAPPADTPLVDLGDSMEYVEAILTLEDDLHVQLSDAEAEGCQTVADLVSLLDRKVAAS